MNPIGNAVRRLREERGWSLNELASKLGTDASSLSRMERGLVRIKPPKRKEFAKAFNMSLARFDAEWRADQLPPQTREHPGIPVINSAPAGVVMDYQEHSVHSGLGYKYLNRGQIDDDHAFAIVVVGDSMAPRISDGDYLVLTPMTVPKPAVELKEGDVVFVRFTPESGREGCMVAYYQPTGNGHIVFAKHNPKYPQINVKPEDIEQISVAIERRERLK